MNREKLQEATMRALQGKLTEEEISGQISFDDVERAAAEKKAAEKEKLVKVVYETRFNLEGPVSDIDDAQAYLSEEDMVQYLDAKRCPAVVDIVSIDWILEDEQSGVIRVKAKRELTDEELDQVSNWISGQNSDGLGEGFEQQDFAECYFNPYSGDGPYSRREAERIIEQKYDEIDIDDIVRCGYLNDAIWNAVEDYKNNNDEEEMDDDEIFDMISDDIYSYLDEQDIEDARYQYSEGEEEFNIDSWYTTASFDWKNNKYKLKRVK